MTHGHPHIIAARSRKGHNSLGNEGPIVDIAVVDISPGVPLEQLHWSSRLNRVGMPNYDLPAHDNEEFEFDFRDHGLDGQRVFAAGYMMLGHLVNLFIASCTCTSTIFSVFQSLQANV